ncbi:hypothetical protein EW026_g8265 [Hermanssonia centrifuga]|uniref:Uncharacterized protein n=1 Tax=Hermanssonia centrifuga TaxID=98765 RepID=A0A4S4K4Q5_9APHY|nr:hypothetical protein EW026_g8265 [Hermanssonia centrifuga]
MSQNSHSGSSIGEFDNTFGPVMMNSSYGMNGGMVDNMSRAQAQFVDQLINDLRLGTNKRTILHQAATISHAQQFTLLTGHILATRMEVQTISDAVTKALVTLAALKDHTRQTWELTEPQQKLLRHTVRHFLIRAVPSYGKYTTQSVETYIKSHASKFKLDGIIEDLIVEQVTHDVINGVQNSQRSNLRKAIFVSIKDKESLDHFINKIIGDWNMGKLPSQATRMSITAQIALMRMVATPLTKKKNNKGADIVNGRNSDAWQVWEDQVIQADADLYGTGRPSEQGTALDDDDFGDIMYAALGDDLDTDPLAA